MGIFLYKHTGTDTKCHACIMKYGMLYTINEVFYAKYRVLFTMTDMKPIS